MGAIRAISSALTIWTAILAALPLSTNAEVQLTALFEGVDAAEATTHTFDSATFRYYGPQNDGAELAEMQAVYVGGRQVCSPNAPVEGKVAVVEWQDATCRRDYYYDAMERAGAKALVVAHRDFRPVGRDSFHHSSWNKDIFKSKSMIMVEVDMMGRQARWAESTESGSLRVSIEPPHSTVYPRYYESWDYILFCQVLLPLLHFWATFIAFFEMRRQYAVSKERAQAPAAALRSSTGKSHMPQADHFIALRFCCAVEVASMGFATILVACGIYGKSAIMPITVTGWFYTLFLGLQMFGSTVLVAVMQEKMSILQQQPGDAPSTFLSGSRRLRLCFNLAVMLGLDGIFGMLMAQDTPHINATLDAIWFLVKFFFVVFMIRAGRMLVMQGRRISKTARAYKARGASTHHAALKHVAFWLQCSGWAIVAQLVCFFSLGMFFLDSSNPRASGGIVFLINLCRIIKSASQTQAMRPAGISLTLLTQTCRKCPCSTQAARVSGGSTDEKISIEQRSSKSEVVLTMGYSESFSFKAPNERLFTIPSSLAGSQVYSSGSGSDDGAVRTEVRHPVFRQRSLWASCCALLSSNPSTSSRHDDDEADRSPPVSSGDSLPATTTTVPENEMSLAVELFRADAEQGFEVEGIAGFVEY